MNNLTLGNDDFTYYETIGGGQGACPDADGPSGVHVAMSNTLNTPVEALELEFPMRIVRSTRSAAGPAARARTAAATGSSASWGARADALLADHRAPAPRPAGRAGGAAAPRGATSRRTFVPGKATGT